MRITKEQIDKLTGFILASLKDKDLVLFKAPETAVIERIRAAISGDVKAEEDLDREVEGILKTHSQAVDAGKVDYRRMFTMVKTKLARERGIVL